MSLTRPASIEPRALRPALAFGAAMLVGACAGGADRQDAAQARRLAAETRGLSDRGLARLSSEMDPAALALARRHDPIAKADLWGRPSGWTSSW